MAGRAMVSAACASVLALACCADEDDGAPPRRWPPGTVLALDDVPITAADVDRVAERIAAVYPQHSAGFHRREALGSFLLPRAALQAYYADARAEAEEKCRSERALLVAGDERAPEPIPITATPEQDTFFHWGSARGLEPGAWSDPLERMGNFVLLRLDARVEDSEALELSVVEFPYVPAAFSPKDLDAAFASARLNVVDPAYDELIPERLRYAMRGESE